MRGKNFYYKLSFIIVLALFAGIFALAEFFNLPPFFEKKPLKLGLDLVGGSRLIYEADMNSIPSKERDSALEGVRDVIERRVNIFGVSEARVVTNKTGDNYRLIVELPGVKDLKKALEWIGETPLLEFKEQNPLPEETDSIDFENWQPWKYTGLDGSKLKTANVKIEQTLGEPQVTLEFREEGIKLFEEITKRNIEKPLAIFLDGKSIVDTNEDGKIDENDIYAPIVKDVISSGEAVISGSMNVDEAKLLAKRLRNGALAVNIGEPIYQKTIGPTLGEISFQKSLKAIMVGFLIICVFMISYYRLPGIVASKALLIYLAILLSLFKLIPVTLTLAGIGGVILSLGMAVDANVLIFERLKEELKEKKPFSIALEEAFNRAWSAIRDGSLTTLLVAFIMFILGTSFVKGFALCLSLGVLVSLFSAVFVTKTFLQLFEETRFEKIKWLWK